MSVKLHILCVLNSKILVNVSIFVVLACSALSVEYLEPMLKRSYEEKTGHRHGKVFFNKGL